MNMLFHLFWIIIISSFPTTSFGEVKFDIPKGFSLDEKEKIDYIELLSGKKGDVRLYQGKLFLELDRDIDKALEAALNFKDRCNNEQAEKRKFWDKKRKCSHKNANLIESVKLSKLKKEPSKLKNQVDAFIVLRRIYKRENFNHYDLVRVFKSETAEGRKKYEVFMEMLDNKKAAAMLDNPMDRESAFLNAKSLFIFEEAAKNKTKFTYYYQSQTDHWLLNKSLASDEVFESMAESFKLLVAALKDLSKS